MKIDSTNISDCTISNISGSLSIVTCHITRIIGNSLTLNQLQIYDTHIVNSVVGKFAVSNTALDGGKEIPIKEVFTKNLLLMGPSIKGVSMKMSGDMLITSPDMFKDNKIAPERGMKLRILEGEIKNCTLPREGTILEKCSVDIATLRNMRK